MANPFVAEIRLFAGNFPPIGWAFCNGQLMSIPQNTALFSLLGTNFGGDGRSTFGLPNLQANAPMHWGNGVGLTPRDIGEVGGTPSVTLLSNQIPAHTHNFQCGSGSKGDNNAVTNNVAADEKTGTIQSYAAAADSTVMSPLMIGPTPPSQPHENRQPFLCLNFIIALQGVFPTRP
jgi:microcystin-dependent protein